MGDIRMAGNISNDVILFNVDSKSSAPKNSIVMVFLKVFNTMLGYSANLPYLADLERRLDAEGKYDEFKAKLLIFTVAEGKICACSEIILQL